MRVANPIDRTLLARIKMHGGDWVFSPSDFFDLGSRAAVDKVLSRMTTGGTIRRLARGLYDMPRTHPVIGTLAPNPEMVAKALAGKDAIRLQPSGAYAANLLGLSDQVPAKIVFLTDGRTKQVHLKHLEIMLKHTTPRNMATAGRLSGLIIQALRHLGKKHVTDDLIQRLTRRLSEAADEDLLKDAAYAPAWIGNILRRIAHRFAA